MLGLNKTIGGLMLGAGLLLGGAAQAADNYPSKPVHILVPYAAGGAVDVLARTLGQALAKTWGQQPVIDNRPGAGGIVASQALTQAAPDGYTLILVASGHPLNQFIYPSVPYDTFRDFTAITEVASSPLAIVVAKDSPYKTLGDLLAAAKKEPDKLSYGMSGNGTSAHLAGELLKYMSGSKIVAIPYKGGAPALTAVIAGEIPLSINPLAEAIGQLEGGPVRALAVTSAERSKALPNVSDRRGIRRPRLRRLGLVGRSWACQDAAGDRGEAGDRSEGGAAGPERAVDAGQDRRGAGRLLRQGL
ncbi:tripartite-type tricarboxylate transporter receptor subunit TctC [Bradyrhizobium sp. i1.3.1]